MEAIFFESGAVCISFERRSSAVWSVSRSRRLSALCPDEPWRSNHPTRSSDVRQGPCEPRGADRQGRPVAAHDRRPPATAVSWGRGVFEALGEVAFERLVKVSNRPKGRARRWLGRVSAFVGCAAIGGLATLLLSAFLSHSPQRYAAEDERLAALPGSSEAAVSPGSQSAALPGTSTAPAPAPKSAAGPATFGLYER